MNEIIKKKKRNKIIISVFILLLIIGLIEGIYLFVDYSFFNENEQFEDKDKDKNTDIEDEIYVNLKRVEKISSLAKKEQLYSKDINSGDDQVVDYIYDGYYVAKIDDTYYLKRNQKVVSLLEKTENFILYKDKSDSNSKYIGLKYNAYDLFEFAYLDNDTYASGWTTDSKTLDNYSIVFNVNTGEYKKFIDNEIVSVIEGNDNKHYMLWTDKPYLLNEDFNIIDTSGYEIVGDTYDVEVIEGLSSNSSKYIVAIKDSKYGLVDYRGKVIIEAVYDDLFAINDDLFYACKEGKYGVINSSNKIIIDFKYDEIVNIDKYYVVTKNNKLGVLDKNGKEVIPINIDIFVEEDSTNDESTSFYTFYNEDKIVVEYCVSVNKDDDYEYDYLVIDKNGSYEKLDKIIYKYYNFSDKYYYVVEDDAVVSIYNQDDDLLGDVKCSGAYDFVFEDEDILSFICSSDDSNLKYFNIKEKKEVLEEDIDMRYDNFEVVGELIVFNVDSQKVVVSFLFNSELIFKLNIDDKFVHICDNYYKIIRSNGKVEYYKLNLNY